jgi:hypothetical protein
MRVAFLAIVLAALQAAATGQAADAQPVNATGKASEMTPSDDRPQGVPAHLPKRLAISSWVWSWVTYALPDEPYGDLEKCMAELKERGFNAIRVDAGLNWCFRADGTPRGEMEFGPWAAGASANLSTVNQRGGGRHDVLKRVVRLMELAKKHDVYVILTSWEYQDSTWMVADPKIRAEVYGIPEKDRLMRLAQHHGRLLRILEDKGIEKHVAFVEVHNEVEYSEFPKGQEGKELHKAAIAFLRARHPDILMSGDYATHDASIVPDNAQVYDQHLYSGAAMYWDNLYSQTVLHPSFDRAHPRKLPLLERLLKKDIVPWDDFAKHTGAVRPFWHPIMWLYENVDNARFDEYMLESLPRWEPKIKTVAAQAFETDAHEAARRNIPAVLDEGGFFFPPYGSRWEQSPQALAYLEFMCDLAVKHRWWGFMPTTYCGPEHPLWRERPEWLKKVNTRFRVGAPE